MSTVFRCDGCKGVFETGDANPQFMPAAHFEFEIETATLGKVKVGYTRSLELSYSKRIEKLDLVDLCVRCFCRGVAGSFSRHLRFVDPEVDDAEVK